ncbi:peptide maturation system acyl carrier-related protein [Ruminiclostridium josui]|nr:peptide maturation system acyl carrier-related protein [Ruminiclostridium josui]
MEREEVVKRLIILFNNMFNKNIDNTMVNEHYFSNTIAISPRELVYYFLEVETEFSVQIPEKYIADGSFCTINKTADILLSLKVDSLKAVPCPM